MNSFVYGTDERIFVNTDMGCRANCTYCYLPYLNIEHCKRKISAEMAINLVEQLECYKEGMTGSIISIGCYSECMDKENISDTTKIIQYFLKKGNYVQFATKKGLEKEVLKKISNYKMYEKQLWVCVSIPLISDSRLFEPGTDRYENRIYNFQICKELNIDSLLYIKPYIENHTDKDLDIYMNIIRKYKVPVVVGNYLTIQKNETEALIGENRLYEVLSDKKKEFVQKLSKLTEVYEHSIDVISEMQRR